MRLSDPRSILGLVPTRDGLAYAFFERGELLDWGERTVRGAMEDVLAVVDDIASGCAADVIVLEDPDAAGCRRGRRTRLRIAGIARYLRRRNIPSVAVAMEAVRTAWRLRGVTSKERMASAIARDLPELAPLVPPYRKAFMRETERLHIFEAVALVLHAFGDGSAP